jgi:choline dehydrogenase
MRTLLKYSKSSSEKQFIHNYDYVIIGGGTAGCLLANRLSKCSSITVALIEAGQSNRYNPLVHVPVGYLFCMGNPLTDWCFKTSVEKGLNQRSIRYPRGRVLGGCSSINGMIYMRGQENDYNTWATLVNDSIWNWNNCLPYFKKHEDYYGGLNEYHGQGG